MSQSSLQELQNLKIIYYEIINGCSFIPSLNVYIKHFTELDNIEISNQKKIFFNKYIEEGIPSYKDRIKLLIDNGDWSIKEEENIDFLKNLINDNEKNVKVIKEQQSIIEKVIKDKKSELTQILFNKRNIVGSTAEEFAERDIINYITYQGIYTDNHCKNKFFKSFEELQDYEDKKLDIYIEAMDSALTKFTENNIRKIAAMPFFISMFSYVKEDIASFFKKPIIELSNYQFLLISFGSRNLGVLQSTEGEPPDILTNEDIEKVVNFYDLEFSVLMGKRKSSK